MRWWPFARANAGDRISLTGDWVLDTEHGWNELHPFGPKR
jgi:hypothetical protein